MQCITTLKSYFAEPENSGFVCTIRILNYSKFNYWNLAYIIFIYVQQWICAVVSNV
jgi:hypothetical protein